MADPQMLENVFGKFNITSRQIKIIRQIAYDIMATSSDYYYDMEKEDDRLHQGYKYFIGKTLARKLLYRDGKPSARFTVEFTHGELEVLFSELVMLIDCSDNKAEKTFLQKINKLLFIDSGYTSYADEDYNHVIGFCKNFLKKDTTPSVHPKGFSCKCCGECCSFFSDAYQGQASESDILRWSLYGRFDILEWVDNIWDFWISPKTHDDVARCPWLRKLPKGKGFKCKIHELKPDTCRIFPHSKKHALQSGCRGFEISR